MHPLSTRRLIPALGRLRPGADLTSPEVATRTALHSIARRHAALAEEIKDLDTALAELTAIAAPGLLAKTGVGVGVAAQLLVTAGDNPERLRSEASFAHLTGASPIQASATRSCGQPRLLRGRARLLQPPIMGFIDAMRAGGLGSRRSARSCASGPWRSPRDGVESLGEQGARAFRGLSVQSRVIVIARGAW